MLYLSLFVVYLTCKISEMCKPTDSHKLAHTHPSPRKSTLTKLLQGHGTLKKGVRPMTLQEVERGEGGEEEEVFVSAYGVIPRQPSGRLGGGGCGFSYTSCKEKVL